MVHPAARMAAFAIFGVGGLVEEHLLGPSLAGRFPAPPPGTERVRRPRAVRRELTYRPSVRAASVGPSRPRRG